jgi:hypothetical protein
MFAQHTITTNRNDFIFVILICKGLKFKFSVLIKNTH